MRRFLQRYPALSAFLAAFLITGALGGLWAVASPLMSGPDEHSHMIKAGGVVRGQFEGEPVEGEPGFRAVDVPSYFGQLKNGMCYVFHADMPAGCMADIDGSNDEIVTVMTAAGTYNPLYYLLVGWPSLIVEDEAALFGMRFAGVLVNALVIASGFAALALRRTGAFTLVGAAIGLTPMVLFLTSVVNPSGLEIAAGFALACWLSLLVARERRTGDLAPIIGVVVTAALLSNTRAVGPVWAAVIIGVFLVEGRVWVRLARNWRFWAGVAVIAAAVIFAAWWMLVGAGGSEAREGLSGAGNTTFRQGFVKMLSLTLQNSHGYIGVFGWLDTIVPDTIVFVWSGAMLALVAVAAVLGRGWHFVKLMLMVAAFVLLPAVMQGYTWNEVGFIWQARYLLAILLPLLILAGATLDDAVSPPRATRTSVRGILLFAIVFVIMHVFSFIWALKRYIVGLGEEISWSPMLTNPQWNTPFLDWKIVAVLYALVIGLAFAIVVAFFLRVGPFRLEASPDARGASAPGGAVSSDGDDEVNANDVSANDGDRTSDADADAAGTKADADYARDAEPSPSSAGRSEA